MSKTVWVCLSLLFVITFSGGSRARASDNPPITTPVLVDDSQLQLHDRPLPPRHDECALCHTKKNRFFAKKSGVPQREHADISATHGKRDMSCNMCHDINNHNYLLSSKKLKADFNNAAPVCARCHQERYRDWKRGLHGKRLGGWMQPKVQLHCIDCHRPHSVKFPSMSTTENPAQSPYVIPKPEHHDNGPGHAKTKGESH